MKNDSIDNLRLDINKSKVNAVIYVRAGDTRTRTVHITLANNGTVYDLSETLIAEILIKKPDGNQNDQAMVRYGNELQYTWRTQDINVVGEARAQVMVTFNDGAVITSPEFSVMVYEKEVDPVLEKSSNEYSAISQMMIDMADNAKLANDSAIIAREASITADNVLKQAEIVVEEIKADVETASSASRDAVESKEIVLAGIDTVERIAEETSTVYQNTVAASDRAVQAQASAESASSLAQNYMISSAESSESASASASEAQNISDDMESYVYAQKVVIDNAVASASTSAINAENSYQQAKAIVETIPTVSVTQIATEGEHIADIYVGSDKTELYAPEGGGISDISKLSGNIIKALEDGIYAKPVNTDYTEAEYQALSEEQKESINEIVLAEDEDDEYYADASDIGMSDGRSVETAVSELSETNNQLLLDHWNEVFEALPSGITVSNEFCKIIGNMVIAYAMFTSTTAFTNSLTKICTIKPQYKSKIDVTRPCALWNGTIYGHSYINNTDVYVRTSTSGQTVAEINLCWVF